MQRISEHEWQHFSRQAEAELIPTYQEEIMRRMSELNEYISTVPDALPNKHLLELLGLICIDLTFEERLNSLDQTKKHFIGSIDQALKQLGYAAVSCEDFMRLQLCDDTLQQILRSNSIPEHLRTISAAKQELNRLRPWAERGIGEERDYAKACMSEIYTRFPELKPAN